MNLENAYTAILSARFRVLLQYRSAAFAGMFTQTFWGLVRCMVFAAFFHATAKSQPMSLDQTITYIWLGQALFAMLPWQVDEDVQEMIKSGTVAYEMVRPIDLYYFWFMRTLAKRTAPVLLRAVPMLIIARYFLGLSLPYSWQSFSMWAVMTIGAALLSSAIATLMTVSLLWTISGDGISRFVPIFAYLFSGVVIPLSFFPDWSQPILNGMPFRFLLDIPVRVYMGQISGSEWIILALYEAAWIIALIMIGRVMLMRGLRHLVVQGG